MFFRHIRILRFSFSFLSGSHYNTVKKQSPTEKYFTYILHGFFMMQIEKDAELRENRKKVTAVQTAA